MKVLTGCFGWLVIVGAGFAIVWAAMDGGPPKRGPGQAVNKKRQIPEKPPQQPPIAVNQTTTDDPIDLFKDPRPIKHRYKEGGEVFIEQDYWLWLDEIQINNREVMKVEFQIDRTGFRFWVMLEEGSGPHRQISTLSEFRDATPVFLKANSGKAIYGDRSGASRVIRVDIQEIKTLLLASEAEIGVGQIRAKLSPLQLLAIRTLIDDFAEQTAK